MTEPVPAPGEVHLWWGRVPAAVGPDDLAPLTAAERDRAGLIRPPGPRAEFVAGRALARRVLARYLDRAPTSIGLALGVHGKPYLTGADAVSGLEFNVSHSAGLLGVAVAAADAVGIDLEHVRPTVRHADLARRFFSAHEQAQLAALPEPERAAGFFRIWTTKEAYLKGRGDGITHGLDVFDVTVGPGAARALTADRRDPAAVARWGLVALRLEGAHVGACALGRPAPPAVVERRLG